MGFPRSTPLSKYVPPYIITKKFVSYISIQSSFTSVYKLYPTSFRLRHVWFRDAVLHILVTILQDSEGMICYGRAPKCPDKYKMQCLMITCYWQRKFNINRCPSIMNFLVIWSDDMQGGCLCNEPYRNSGDWANICGIFRRVWASMRWLAHNQFLICTDKYTMLKYR